jgi:hypothetical protein
VKLMIYQMPLSLPVSFSSSAAAAANPGSRLNRMVLRSSPFNKSLPHSEK